MWILGKQPSYQQIPWVPQIPKPSRSVFYLNTVAYGIVPGCLVAALCCWILWDSGWFKKKFWQSKLAAVHRWLTRCRTAGKFCCGCSRDLSDEKDFGVRSTSQQAQQLSLHQTGAASAVVAAADEKKVTTRALEIEHNQNFSVQLPASLNGSTAPISLITQNLKYVQPNCGTCFLCQSRFDCPMKRWHYLNRIRSAWRVYMFFALPVGLISLCYNILITVLPKRLDGVTYMTTNDSILYTFESLAGEWSTVTYLFAHAAISGLLFWVIGRRMNLLSKDSSVHKTVHFVRRLLWYASVVATGFAGTVVECVFHWVFLASYQDIIPLSTLWKPLGVLLWIILIGTVGYIAVEHRQFTRSLNVKKRLVSTVTAKNAIAMEQYTTGNAKDVQITTVVLKVNGDVAAQTATSPKINTYHDASAQLPDSSEVNQHDSPSPCCGCSCCCSAASLPFQHSKASPETRAGCISRLLFSWVRPLLSLGYARPLEFPDLFEIPKMLETLETERMFSNYWIEERERHKQQKPASLIRACWKWVKCTLITTGVVKLIYDTLIFSGALLLNYFINFLERVYSSLYPTAPGSSPLERPYTLGALFLEGLIVVFIMCLSSSVQTMLLQQYFYIQFTVGMKLRAAVSGLVYHKALRIAADKEESFDAVPTTLSELMVQSKDAGDHQRRRLSRTSSVPFDEDPLGPSVLEVPDDVDFGLEAKMSTYNLPGSSNNDDGNAQRRKSGAGNRLTQTKSLTTPVKQPPKKELMEVTSTGKIVNLMSVDAQRLLDCMPYLHIVWSGPYQMILALVLLWYHLGPSMFTGVGVMCASVPASALLARASKRAQERLMLLRDERIKVTNEALAGIKIIKLYAWEKSFEDKVTELRRIELKGLWKYTCITTAQRIIWNGVPVLVSLLTFLTYVAVGNKLTPAKAFTAIALFQNLRFPLSAFPNVVSLVVEANVACKRIQKFLLRPEIPELLAPPPFSMTDRQTPSVVAHNLSVSWPSGVPLIRHASFSCCPGTITAIVGVTGVGKSGLLACLIGDLLPDKTEQKHSESLRPLKVEGRIAYVAQTAWIQNATLRENVLFGKPYDAQWYNEVLESCALIDDIRVLPSGDTTEIGEKGVNLSGGQKQRVALARAVYQCKTLSSDKPNELPADIYILDDCLSAVDAHVGQHIFDRCIQRILKASNRTVILVTHKFSVLPDVNQIILLFREPSPSISNAFATGARIAAVGTHEQLLQRDLPLYKSFVQGDALVNATENTAFADHLEQDGNIVLESALLRSNDVSLTQPIEFQPVQSSSSPLASRGRTDSAAKPDDTSSQERVVEGIATAVAESPCEDTKARVLTKSGVDAIGILTEKENVELGAVGARVYLAYLNGVGGPWIVALVLFALALSQGAQVGSNLWLSYWSSHRDTIPGLPTGIGVYAGFGASQVVFFALVSITIGLTSLWASRFFHRSLLQSLLRAPMAFFDTTPLGRIMNRFSKDLYTIDQTLPSTLSMYIVQVFTVAGTFLVICFVTPSFIAVCIPLIILYTGIQHYYIPTSRQLQRLESMLKSPVFAHFSETLCGVSTIRAFRCQSRFLKANADKMDQQQRAYYLLVATNRWLAVRLEFLGTTVVFFSTLSVLMGGLNGTISQGLAGVVFSYALNVTQSLNWLVRMASDRETNIVSVERVEEYSNRIPQEAQSLAPSGSARNSITTTTTTTTTEMPKDLDDTWPTRGAITFANYSLRYRPGLPLVLYQLNISIQPQEKVGVVGRTGAGKSSVLLALMRLIEPAEGTIYVDQVDISRIPLQTLRSRFSIIPQDPILFTGSLRFNVDPFDSYTDDEVWSSLERAHLGRFVSREFQGGLYGVVEENGGNLSQGQRQLLCLARALLRKSPILLLDEATSAVDPVTDRLIQNTIQEEFKHCTILTIAHRLGTIMDYDRILVLDNGRVAEFDSPANLLSPDVTPTGVFRALCAKDRLPL